MIKSSILTTYHDKYKIARMSRRFGDAYHISHNNPAATADDTNDPLTIKDIAPLDFEDAVEDGAVSDLVSDGGEAPDLVSELVSDGGGEIPDAVAATEVVAEDNEAAEEDNAAPTASAAAWKAAKELLVPLAPGLTANTIPFPQWLAGVFSPCRQYTQIGFVWRQKQTEKKKKKNKVSPALSLLKS